MRRLQIRQAFRGLQATQRAVCRPCQAHRCLSNAAALTESDERKWSTPLAKQLAEAIQITGPIPLASYMRMCLTADIGGYYTGALEQGRDQFGTKGDFVTSPEISQVFGELVGIWFVTEWLAQGKPKEVEFIEVGPGRGTLMDDVLRTIFSFKELASSITSIYMVEASSELRGTQQKLLSTKDAVVKDTKTGWESICKYGSVPIKWTETIQSVPHDTGKTPFIIAHEFFDALPIHAFQNIKVQPKPNPPDISDSEAQISPSPPAKSSTLQWRELVVSPTPPNSTHASLGTPKSQQRDTPPPDFQLTLFNASTRHSTYLPGSSPRYASVSKIPDALIEICPDAALYAADFARRIGTPSPASVSAANTTTTFTSRRTTPSGAALILDYGPGDGSIPINSLRGISRHRRVSPFTEPGLTDLSADVDFGAIAEVAIGASEGVEVHGPVEQGVFLDGMGIRQRVEMLVKAASNGRQLVKGSGGGNGDGVKKAEDIEKAWKRLVDRGPGGMGKVYKALAIVPENGGKRRLAGFGGDVV